MNILIIEDETDICEILKESLEYHTPNVFEAHSLKEAEAIFQSKPIGIVIADDNLGDGSGFKYVMSKKAQGYKFDVIGMSGKLIRMADFKFFCKPFNFDELVKSVLYYMKDNRTPIKSFWRDALLINHADIDSDHKHLVGLISQLHNERDNGATAEVLAHTLEELEEYCIQHFSNEEAIMDSSEVHKKHKEDHRTFTQKVHEFRSKFVAGEAQITEELFEFLFKWLTNHIEIRDKQLAATGHSH